MSQLKPPALGTTSTWGGAYWEGPSPAEIKALGGSSKS